MTPTPDIVERLNDRLATTRRLDAEAMLDMQAMEDARAEITRLREIVGRARALLADGADLLTGARHWNDHNQVEESSWEDRKSSWIGRARAASLAAKGAANDEHA